MTTELSARTADIKRIFSSLGTSEARYERLIELGRKLPSYPADRKTADRIVSGCQSTLYLDAEIREGKIFFKADSEALISKGLAALLIGVYNGLSPEALLQSPTFLQEIGIFATLSPSRSNGLAHIYLRMKSLALFGVKARQVAAIHQ